MSNKLYPKFAFDKWLKWYYDSWDKHYTLRLAWNPMILLQGVYEKLWWTDFIRIYNIIKESKWWLPIPEADTHSVGIMRTAIKQTNEMLDVFQYVGNSWISLFVIYENDISDFK